MDSLTSLAAAGVVGAAVGLSRLMRRLQLSRAKHFSVAGHARIARGIAKLIPFYEFNEDRFFVSPHGVRGPWP
jgi:glutamate-1-semialdehyde 2,1-aminomutase